MKKYYEEAKYNAAFDRCVDVMSQMLQKYGHQVLNKLEQDAPQGVEHSEESNQAQLLTDKAAYGIYCRGQAYGRAGYAQSTECC